jgi:hypothetical protein
MEQGALIVGNNSGHNVLALTEKAPQDLVALATLYYTAQVGGAGAGDGGGQMPQHLSLPRLLLRPLSALSSASRCKPNFLIRLSRFVRANADSDFPVKPFEKIEQFVRGTAATMAVHQVGDIRLGNTEQSGNLTLLELRVFEVGKPIAGAFFTFFSFLCLLLQGTLRSS